MYNTIEASVLKNMVPPLEFYRQELPQMPPPRQVGGWSDGGLCPFHDDHRTGNFRVNVDTGAFTCFACGAKGTDILAFTQLRHGLSFPDAIVAIAQAWGLSA